MKKHLIFILFGIAFMSCGRKAEEAELPTFETPQPNGKRDIKGFPKKWIGQYVPILTMSKLDFILSQPDTVLNTKSDTLTKSKTNVLERMETVLSVHKDLIIERETYHSRSLLDSLGRIEFNHDTVFIFDKELHWKVRIEGDSIFQDRYSTDTLYSRQRGDLLRKFKSYYFINRKTYNGKWFVRRLSTFKGALVIGTISSTADMDKLKLISAPDTLDNFKLTRKQFKSSLRQMAFLMKMSM